MNSIQFEYDKNIKLKMFLKELRVLEQLIDELENAKEDCGITEVLRTREVLKQRIQRYMSPKVRFDKI